MSLVLYMWLDLPKGFFLAHNFHAHFSSPLNKYSNKQTVNVCSTAKVQQPAFTETSSFSMSDIQEC